jgi:hypothetical protein
MHYCCVLQAIFDYLYTGAAVDDKAVANGEQGP